MSLKVNNPVPTLAAMASGYLAVVYNKEIIEAVVKVTTTIAEKVFEEYENRNYYLSLLSELPPVKAVLFTVATAAFAIRIQAVIQPIGTNEEPINETIFKLFSYAVAGALVYGGNLGLSALGVVTPLTLSGAVMLTGVALLTNEAVRRAFGLVGIRELKSV